MVLMRVDREKNVCDVRVSDGEAISFEDLEGVISLGMIILECFPDIWICSRQSPGVARMTKDVEIILARLLDL